MALLGPNGQPIAPGVNLAQGRIVGGPKSIEDFPDLTGPQIANLLESLRPVIAQIIAIGQPLDIPAAQFPAHLAAQVANTLKHQYEMCQKMEPVVKAAEAYRDGSGFAEEGEAVKDAVDAMRA